MMPIVNIFGGAGFDRAAALRRDAGWIAARLADPASRVAPLWELKPLFAQGAPRVRWLSAPEAAALPVSMSLFLGMAGDVAHFAMELSADDPAALEELPRDAEFQELRRHAAALPAQEAGMLALARGMLHWHAMHRFCGRCGAPTDARDAGHLRVCTRPECGLQHFPRTDPAVIMLVTHGERALLGRQASWDAGRYSSLAGFVEPGESLEDAVAREVREETGITVGEVRYHSSQPWPFPASLMVGFTAEAADHTIRVDADELEDARWFTRREMLDGVEAGTLLLPSPLSISHRLLADWLAGG
jgi:NAD+ diphosphatase